MLGGDLVLSGGLVRDPRLDYVALGHIHKPQDLNENAHPPVIYPGSIERVDFGEAGEDRYYVIANVERSRTSVEWRQLAGVRPFINCYARLEEKDGDFSLTERLRNSLPSKEKLVGAIVRLIVEYPRAWESMIDDAPLRAHAVEAFEFHLVKHPQMDSRIRLPEGQAVGSMKPFELLQLFWDANHVDRAEQAELARLAQQIIRQSTNLDLNIHVPEESSGNSNQQHVGKQGSGQ
jgi:exonuclease SbcD